MGQTPAGGMAYTGRYLLVNLGPRELQKFSRVGPSSPRSSDGTYWTTQYVSPSRTGGNMVGVFLRRRRCGYAWNARKKPIQGQVQPTGTLSSEAQKTTRRPAFPKNYTFRSPAFNTDQLRNTTNLDPSPDDPVPSIRTRVRIRNKRQLCESATTRGRQPASPAVAKTSADCSPRSTLSDCPLIASPKTGRGRVWSYEFSSYTPLPLVSGRGMEGSLHLVRLASSSVGQPSPTAAFIIGSPHRPGVHPQPHNGLAVIDHENKRRFEDTWHQWTSASPPILASYSARRTGSVGKGI
ncbi:hypothetical protein CPLU01_07317 [Colletotrichum plurivorum]|uniref:Uncharacterized protein n=1 Tax=Colletotrichum plurivorum TaxID=2175906 RepID=A0A8H6KFX2_9PEZI|nr:hypothetical protein CPLU01_07317 [Colletotrichum plurivorum]